jgi:hypothetical protein
MSPADLSALAPRTPEFFDVAVVARYSLEPIEAN